ncbi:MAG: citrate synthase [Alphaproteobacteria bacterium]|jgi:citrate synthase|nr:citrate synthase [Alphaproteobacteria bacterium]
MSVGLEGIVAAETRLSRVDGIAGRLIVVGHDVEELVADWSLPEVAASLWNEYAETPKSSDQVALDLGRARLVAADLVPHLLRVSGDATPVEALRIGWSLLNDSDPKKHGIDSAVLLTGAAPVFIAAHWRHCNMLGVIAPDPGRGHAADFLAMLGLNHEPRAARALERYLITIADHGMNASTFTARVVASTQAGEISSVVAALCALKGPLHGGAPGPVMDMLDEIASEANIMPWIHAALADGSRLMGFRHRVYRTRDPRADVLKEIVRDLKNSSDRIAFAEAVENGVLETLEARYPDRRLDTNVEFYTALVLDGIGLPRELFTPAFAMGRVIGWCAHIEEQVASGRLIRPASSYVGDLPEGAAALQMAG